MGTTQHTPGPWVTDGQIANDTLDIVASGVRIALIDGEGGEGFGLTDETMEANARLIAAAPELLAACIDALEVEENMAQCPDSELAKRLRAAIAKAKGEV